VVSKSHHPSQSLQAWKQNNEANANLPPYLFCLVTISPAPKVAQYAKLACKRFVHPFRSGAMDAGKRYEIE
jgi:hypothetical protein